MRAALLRSRFLSQAVDKMLLQSRASSSVYSRPSSSVLIKAISAPHAQTTLFSPQIQTSSQARRFSSGGREKRPEKFYKVEVEVKNEVDLDRLYEKLVVLKKLNESVHPNTDNYLTTRRIVVISDGSYRSEDSSPTEDKHGYSSIGFVVLDCGRIRSFHGQRFNGIKWKDGKIESYGSSTRSELFAVNEIGRYLNKRGIKVATIVVDCKVIEDLWNGIISKIENNLAACQKVKKMKKNNPGFTLIHKKREGVDFADNIARCAGEGELYDDYLTENEELVKAFLDGVQSETKFDTQSSMFSLLCFLNSVFQVLFFLSS